MSFNLSQLLNSFKVFIHKKCTTNINGNYEQGIFQNVHFHSFESDFVPCKFFFKIFVKKRLKQHFKYETKVLFGSCIGYFQALVIEGGFLSK